MDYKAVVVDEPFSEGKVVITERLTFDIHAASENNLFWELWRDLPEDYVDGAKVHYKVNSVKQIFDDGTEFVYEESPKLYWDDEDYVSTNPFYGPGKWYHSEGPYDESDAQYECVFFYVDGLYREEVVFEIEYEMYNAALRYNDCSDLYLSLYSGDTIKHLESFKAQILFPNVDMPDEGNYNVYTYGTNANEFPVTESATVNPGYYTFSFELDEEQLQFKPYNEYIEFDLVSYNEDKHIFTEYTFYNDYSGDNVLEEIYEEQEAYATAPERFEKIKWVVLILAVVISIFIIIYAVRKVFAIKAKYTFYEPAMETDYYREIAGDLDPNFAAALAFCKHKPLKDDSGVYSTLLLSLARKNYIELMETVNNDVVIVINQRTWRMPQQDPLSGIGTQESMEINETLTPSEEYYYNLLLRHEQGEQISMSTLQKRVSSDYEYTESFARNIQNAIVNIGVNGGFFQKADYSQPKKQISSVGGFLRVVGILCITLVNIFSYQTRLELAFGAFFILGASCIISSIFLYTQSKKLILLTQFGEDEYVKWRGLYNFLNSDTLIHERTVIELPLWERYLVYATAFGISEKVIKAINLRCPEMAANSIVNSRCCRSGRVHTYGRRVRTSVRTGSHGGSSGGFGYGGGDRGGGGGGGGH